MVVALGSPLGSCCLLLARNPKMYFTAYTVEQQASRRWGVGKCETVANFHMIKSH